MNTKSLEDVIHEAIEASGLGTPEQRVKLTKDMQQHIGDFIALMPALELLAFTRSLMGAAVQLAEQHPKPNHNVTRTLRVAHQELHLCPTNET